MSRRVLPRWGKWHLLGVGGRGGGVRTEWQLSLSAKAFVSECELHSLMDEFFLVVCNAAALLRHN